MHQVDMIYSSVLTLSCGWQFPENWPLKQVLLQYNCYYTKSMNS